MLVSLVIPCRHTVNRFVLFHQNQSLTEIAEEVWGHVDVFLYDDGVGRILHGMSQIEFCLVSESRTNRVKVKGIPETGLVMLRDSSIFLTLWFMLSRKLKKIIK